jgi:hypothetical protein
MKALRCKVYILCPKFSFDESVNLAMYRNFSVISLTGERRAVKGMAPKKASGDVELHTDIRFANVCQEWMDACRQKILERAAMGLFCRTIVDQILVEVGDEIVRAHMDNLAVPWTVQHLLCNIFESVHVAFPSREEELLDDESSDELEHSGCLERIEEPRSIAPDSWSRGTMPRRKKLQLLTATSAADIQQLQTGKIALARKKDGPVARPVTPTNAAQDPDASRPTSATSSRMTGSQTGGVSRPHKPRRSDHSKKRSAQSPNAAQPDAAQAVLTVQQTEEDVRIALKQKEMEARMAALRRQAERLQHQLMDIKPLTPFTTDGNTVIVVNPVTDAMLPPRVEPRVTIDKQDAGGRKQKKGQELQPPPNEDSAHITPDRALSPGLVTEQKKRGPDYSLFYKQEAAAQPMISEFAPAAGVTSKDGEVTKRTELKLPKTRMSRSEYSKLLSTSQTQQVPQQQLGQPLSVAGSSVSTPVSQPLSPLAKPGKGRRSNAGSASSTPALQPALHYEEGALVFPDAILELGQRALTPQPTATRPKYPKAQSPKKRENPQRLSRPSSSMSMSALSDTAAIIASRKSLQRNRLRKATMVEDDVSRDFVEDLETSET